MPIKPIRFIIKTALSVAALWVLSHHESWACSYPSGDPLATRKGECDARQDRSWSCRLNRCIATGEVLRVEKTFSQCDGIEDSGDANRCLVDAAKALAESEKGVDTNKNKVETKNRFGLTVQSTLGSYYLLSAFVLKAGKKCTGIATKLMAAAGGVSVGGSLVAFKLQKKKSKQLAEEYQKLLGHNSPQSVQVEAFNYFIKEQEILEKSATNFARVNQLASGLFSAAAITGTLTMLKGGDICPAEPPLSVKALKASEFMEEYFSPFFIVINPLLFPAAQAKESFLSKLVPAGAGLGLAALITSSGKQGASRDLNNYLRTNQGIIILAAVGASASLYTATLYGREAKAAKERREKLTEMRDAFAKRVGFYDCPSREDPRNPQCFCFVKGTTLNPDRHSSEVCKRYFPSSNGDDDLTANDYQRYERDTGAPQTGCVTKQGAFDPECLCREQMSQGHNNCMKVSFNPEQFKFGGLGQTVGRMVDTANQLNGGASGWGNLNDSSLGQGAAKLRKALAKVSHSMDKKLRAKGEKGFPFNDTNMRNGLGAVRRAFGPSGRALADGFGGGPGLASGGGAPPAIAKALASASKEMGKKGAWGKGKSGNANDLFDLERSSAANSQESIQYPDKDYDYNGNDVSSKGDSIWKILTHRYQESALPRLFE